MVSGPIDAEPWEAAVDPDPPPEVGYFVPRIHDRCTRCGDQNYDGDTRVCHTCTYPDHPCSRVWWEDLRHARSEQGGLR